MLGRKKERSEWEKIRRWEKCFSFSKRELFQLNFEREYERACECVKERERECDRFSEKASERERKKKINMLCTRSKKSIDMINSLNLARSARFLSCWENFFSGWREKKFFGSEKREMIIFLCTCERRVRYRVSELHCRASSFGI